MRFLASTFREFSNQKFYIALSSGADSVAISHFLKTKYPTKNLECVHFNHMLRSQNFEMEEKAVEFCHTFKIPLKVSRRKVTGETPYSESVLRSLRYESFRGLSAVVTGHHLDDAVESYLMNCFNGVPDYLPIPVKTEFTSLDFSVYRPFIISTREDILKYIKENNLEQFVVEDETNRDEKYRRNWIRNTIVPEIDKFYNLQTIVKKRYLQKEKGR